MEFGKVDIHELNNIDFSLLAEPDFNKRILSGNPATDAKVYLGCAKWGRLEWVGKLYPPKTKEKNFLQHYVEHYNCIELNATHYKIIGAKGISRWKEKAKGKDFKFCPKMYQGVTHKGSLKGKEFLTREFLRGVQAFEEHLGPIFVQVSDTFSPNRKDELFGFMLSLPTELQFFLEVRHPAWFSKEKTREELFEFLSENNIGAVITDTAGRRDCAHMHLTVPKAFIRYVGNSLHPTDYTRSDIWVQRIKYWLEHGLKELYFFMHMHDESTAPELTVYLVDKLNEECGLYLTRPKFIEEMPSKKKTQKKISEQ
jgi:uncharacterized protein YecE (DUF72 family)